MISLLTTSIEEMSSCNFVMYSSCKKLLKVFHRILVTAII